MKELTFDRLVRLEPRLLGLVQEAALVNDSAPNFCANEIWSEQFKPRLMRLVGWYAECAHPEVQDEAAYQVAYDVVYRALPDCRNCACKAAIAALLGTDTRCAGA